MKSKDLRTFFTAIEKATWDASMDASMDATLDETYNEVLNETLYESLDTLWDETNAATEQFLHEI